MKKDQEEILVETKVWTCSGQQCKGWMRAEFTFQATSPQCPLCSQSMVPTTKLLPKIPKMYI
ncbi:cold-shock protein [Xylanibacillus composti]|nr:cold-shock protein [Xylanibacillus composti]